MIEIALLIILCIILVALVFAIYLQLKFRIVNQEPEKKKQPQWKDTTRYNRYLYEALFKLKKEFHADHVCIARLHNGGYFNNEFPIRRFSVVMEAHNPDRTGSMADQYRDVHISKYPDVMHQLIFLKSYSCSNMQFCEDSKFKSDMVSVGYNSSYLFLIRQVDEDRTPEAFLWINYKRVTQMSKQEESEIWAKHNRILNYLNMAKEV